MLEARPSHLRALPFRRRRPSFRAVRNVVFLKRQLLLQFGRLALADCSPLAREEYFLAIGSGDPRPAPPKLNLNATDERTRVRKEVWTA